MPFMATEKSRSEMLYHCCCSWRWRCSRPSGRKGGEAGARRRRDAVAVAALATCEGPLPTTLLLWRQRHAHSPHPQDRYIRAGSRKRLHSTMGCPSGPSA
jgi:hypothetical protein